MRKIDWKSGSGAIIYGTCIMLAGVMLMFLCMERWNVYHSSVYTQTRTDAISDGAAEYGQQIYGSGIDTNKSEYMANQIKNYNNALSGKDMIISIDTSQLTAEGNTQLKVTSQTTMNMMFSDTRYKVTKDSTSVPIKGLGYELGYDSSISPEDFTQPVKPKFISNSVNRSASKSIDVVRQFGVMANPRYLPYDNGNSKGPILIWDYTSAMNCYIPNPNILGNPSTSTELCEWMAGEGVNYGWYEVEEETAQMRASDGHPVVLFEYAPGQAGESYVVLPDVGVTYDNSKGVKMASVKGLLRTESCYSNGNLSGVGTKRYFTNN